MLNYIRADLSRILRRVPRILLLLLSVAGFAIYFLYQSSQYMTWNSVTLLASVSSALIALDLAFGLIEIHSVFSDDFKAKTMQVTIGIGTPRRRVVLSKQLELLILLTLDFLVMFVIILGAAAATDVTLDGSQLAELAIYCVSGVLTSLVAGSLSMIPLFYLQNATLSLLIYIIVSLDPISMILNMLTPTSEILAELNLSSYLYSSLLSIFRAQLILGRFSLRSFIGILIYLLIGYGASSLIFQKRELEF